MTRKEIVKALRCCNSETECRGCPFEEQEPLLGPCAEKVLSAAADMLEQDAKKTSWISVKDRLPEPNERVLAYFPGTRDSEAVILPSKGWAVNKFVSHWMPLPEPPKEEAK